MSHRTADQGLQAGLDQVSSECVEIRLVPDLLQYATLRAGLEDLDGTPMINLSQVPLEGWQSLAKRGIDLMISALAMLVLSPLLPLSCIPGGLSPVSRTPRS